MDLNKEEPQFLLCSDRQALVSRLTSVLSSVGPIIAETPSVPELPGRMDALRPSLVFLDFLSDENDATRELACRHAAELARRYPHIPTVAIGKTADPNVAISAFRAGARDFVDLDNEGDFAGTIQRLLDSGKAVNPIPKTEPPGSLLLLGARAGMGVSTLATHMAGLMQQRLIDAAEGTAGRKKKTPRRQPPEARPLSERICLLDLGMPVGDNLLYLDIRHGFHFVDAVQNLRRLDDTLLSSALPHNDEGVSVLALPRSLEQVRDASQGDSLALFERLRSYFALLITDTGGLNNPDFIAGLAQSSAHVWVVTDQSLGGLVSLADMLHALDEQKVERSKLKLVINRYDPRYGMNAAQIAERFNLRLLGTLPDRSLALHQSMNLGKLLFEEAPKDPYVKALEALAREIAPKNQTLRRHLQSLPWLQSFTRRIKG